MPESRHRLCLLKQNQPENKNIYNPTKNIYQKKKKINNNNNNNIKYMIISRAKVTIKNKAIKSKER
ncbi:hypothetical protein DOY81_004625 [Sarcophaga bullata]|nr:hypothetical protein DOY81_004625 [Sarcophaga bullata]